MFSSFVPVVIVIKVITTALHHAPIETLWDINKRKQEEFNEKPLCLWSALRGSVVSIFFLVDGVDASFSRAQKRRVEF